jgi:hypothetical protein
VVAGFLAVIVITLGTDEVFHLIGVYPPWGQPVASEPLMLATFYRVIYGIGGSYLTARLAPYKPMKHALVGGAIGTVISIAGAAATWNKGPAFGPHWYPVALIVTAMPCAWAGGKLWLRQLREPAAA